MGRLLPFRPSGETEVSDEPRLVSIDDEAADDVFAALSSDTARGILARLYEEPATATDVADAVDTSLQNARYHLGKLQSAGLVEAVDTWYSSRGTEMTVYAPSSAPLVVAAGREEHTGVLRSALGRLVGAVAALALVSLLVDRAVRLFGPPTVGGDRADGAAAGGQGGAAGGPIPAAQPTTPTPTATPTPLAGDGGSGGAGGGVNATATSTPSPTPTPTSTPTPTPGGVPPDAGAADALGAITPGIAFFAGGLLVLLVAAAWWYWFRYRPLYAA